LDRSILVGKFWFCGGWKNDIGFVEACSVSGTNVYANKFEQRFF